MQESDFPDPERFRTAVLFKGTMLAVCAATTGFLILKLIFAPENAARWGLAVGILYGLCFLGLFGLIRGWLRAVSLIFVGFSFVLIAWLSWTGGGIHAAAFDALFVLVMAAGLWLGARASFAIALASMLLGLVLVRAETTGLLPPSSNVSTPLNRLLGDAFFLLLIGSFVAYYASTLKASLRQVQQRDHRISLIFENVNEIIFFLAVAPDNSFRFESINPMFERTLGIPSRDIVGKTVDEIIPEPALTMVKANYRKAIETGEPVRWDETSEYPAGVKYGVVTITPICDGDDVCTHLIGTVHDITDRKRYEVLRENETRVLELISTGAPQRDIFKQLIHGIENHVPGVMVSILTLDEAGKHVHVAAAPSLPDGFNKAIEGLSIGPAAGSCGTAAYHGRQVVVTDIASDPLWDGYREMALPRGLRACWSTPVFGSDGSVLGTLAMYYTEPRSPGEEEFAVIDRATHLCSVALEHARKEKSIRDSEERFKALFHEAPIGYHEIDADGRITRINQTECAMLGYDKKELLGQHIWKFTDDPQASLASIQYRFSGPAPETPFERTFVRKDGSRFPASLLVRQLMDDDGHIVRLRTTVQDMSGQKEAERRLGESEAQYREVVDTAQDAIFVLSKTGIIQSLNPAYESITGWAPDEWIGRSIFDAVHEEDLPHARELIAQLTRGTLVPSDEIRLKTKSGGLATVEYSLVPQVRNYQFTGVLGIVRNVTERKHLEEQLRRTQRMESLGALAGGIAHDLNNVLAPILLSVEFLQKKIDEPYLRNYVNMLERSALRGRDIVKQVLTFARGTDGEFGVLQLRQSVREIESFIRDTFNRMIILRVELQPDLYPIMGDPTQIHQVLLNLCVNARDAMPEGGTLTISARNHLLAERPVEGFHPGNSGSYVMLSVSDTGSGIPEDLLDNIFEPFFTTKEVGKGTGLGLAMVQSIIEDHRGIVQVASSPQTGTTFDLMFPSILRDSGKVAPESIDDLPHGNGELVFVVDDEHSVVQIARETLHTFGYRSMVALNGQDAVDTMEEIGPETVDVILTDLNMPKMGGLEAIRRIRKIDPHVRIVVVSGSLDQLNVDFRDDPDIDDFLPKPYSAPQLLQRLDAVLNDTKNVLTT